MKMHEVPDYVELRTGNKPPLSTVYNWTNVGRRGIKLKVVLGKLTPKDVFPSVRLTTAPWVDDFIAAVARQEQQQ